jgi:hypothetical protein
MHMHHGHMHHHGRRGRFGRPLGKSDYRSAAIWGGGVPFVIGVIFAPIGINQLVHGPKYMKAFGWAFTLSGALMAIIGAVIAIYYWRASNKVAATTDPPQGP